MTILVCRKALKPTSEKREDTGAMDATTIGTKALKEILFVIIGVVCALLFVGAVRAAVAASRLQRCIDQGTAIYDGKVVSPAPEIGPNEKEKILTERRYYLMYARAEPGFLKLHQKNSDI